MASKQGFNTTWRYFFSKAHNILYEKPMVTAAGGLTARNHAFLLTSPMIAFISVLCIFDDENHVILKNPDNMKKIREEVTLTPPRGMVVFLLAG
jgi:hypothetical protein